MVRVSEKFCNGRCSIYPAIVPHCNAFHWLVFSSELFRLWIPKTARLSMIVLQRFYTKLCTARLFQILSLSYKVSVPILYYLAVLLGEGPLEFVWLPKELTYFFRCDLDAPKFLIRLVTSSGLCGLCIGFTINK